MGKSKDSLRKALRRWLEGAGKVVVVGVGNELRRDDFVGMKIVKALKDFVPERVMLVESETVPESFMDTIIKFNPTHILIIDALERGDGEGAREAMHRHLAEIERTVFDSKSEQGGRTLEQGNPADRDSAG